MSALALLAPLFKDLLDLIPDPKERFEKLQALINACQQIDQSQAQINQAEAQSQSLFVAGWRPFIGWVCGAAFAYHFILQPLLSFAMVNAGVDVDLPEFDMQQLSTVLMGMLGLGGLRTIEKLAK